MNWESKFPPRLLIYRERVTELNLIMNLEIVLLISEKNSHAHSLYLKSALLECILYRPTGKKILLDNSGVTKTAHSIIFSNVYNIFILMIQVMLVYKTTEVKATSALNNK